jgi:hypothetical protein
VSHSRPEGTEMHDTATQYSREGDRKVLGYTTEAARLEGA